tara:strand:- start:396 stop:911 length:516 start_codon:yes stop_codon:yes gene_type:complete
MNKEIKILDKITSDFREEYPEMGLPEELFYFISRSTPVINVDLLVQDLQGRTLLAWRNDRFAGEGWHIPGGILRFKDRILDRVQKVAILELGESVVINPAPITHTEVILPHDTRGHFYSILFNCTLPIDYIPCNDKLTPQDAGYLQWHPSCPSNLVKVHEVYRPYILNELE